MGEILANSTLICGLCTWLICQAMKIVINGIKTHQWSFKNWWLSGGMPSSHSGSAVSVAMSAGLREGFSSALFAVAFIFACVVMYDAAGVRRETGKQGKIINEILRWPEAMFDDSIPDELKEKVGHSPLEVMAGALIGIACAILFHTVFFPKG
ncbi:MAG: divergent PAP2 family protein [Clostridia bacterium]|nr:divergent PAP2 family protein [Clostridia bacterium]MBR6966686.1 divergent PAP2 family protein [Clostridia bacterium]